MNTAAKGNRIHITIFGRRNVGKSAFMNAFLNQLRSIVSSVPGTTTDPVEKAYELQPFGPILITDTAGIDDLGDLGQQRIEKTNLKLKETDFAYLLTNPNELTSFELDLIAKFKNQQIPFMLVINKSDTVNQDILKNFKTQLKSIHAHVSFCSALTFEGIDAIKSKTIKILDDLSPNPPIIKDLVKAGQKVVLVIPIDKEAPVGRIILPQVQILRELLDIGAITLAVQDSELAEALASIKPKADLVVTDSQAFNKVNQIVPKDILLTSFSILYARQRGDLDAYIAGTKIIPYLQENDCILIAELCSHRPIAEDIGRVKIPKWLQEHTQLKLNFETASGKDFPEDLSKYKLIIQCGGCMVNRRLILSRIQNAKEQNVAITNYGIVIAYLNGILPRTLEIFNF
ncbi:MAG: [FeFe] hydrogenase H-cluster maturation GTPase HydF [Candidatus Margulisiibacteriota bacterium]|jgi:[FeFe] hydrogenase H-cluster maturation GTPase HydF